MAFLIEMQDYLNVKFKETGHSNMYFPQVWLSTLALLILIDINLRLLVSFHICLCFAISGHFDYGFSLVLLEIDALNRVCLFSLMVSCFVSAAFN